MRSYYADHYKVKAAAAASSLACQSLMLLLPPSSSSHLILQQQQQLPSVSTHHHSKVVKAKSISHCGLSLSYSSASVRRHSLFQRVATQSFAIWCWESCQLANWCLLLNLSNGCLGRLGRQWLIDWLQQQQHLLLPKTSFHTRSYLVSQGCHKFAF